MNNEEIKLVVSYAEREYVAASRLLFFRSSDTIFRLALFTLMVGGGLVILSFLIDDFPLWVSLSLTILIEVAVLYQVLVSLPRKYFRGDLKFRDRWEFTFSEEGLLARTQQIDSKLAWSLYTRVLEGPEIFLLIYGKDLRTMTLVPKRAFENEAQQNAFRELVTRQITKRDSSQILPTSARE
jgi:hypothetical protein